jgi:hypothetical protein
MSQSRTLCIGMDGHQVTMAVAYVVQEQGLSMSCLSPQGTMQQGACHHRRILPGGLCKHTLVPEGVHAVLFKGVSIKTYEVWLCQIRTPNAHTTTSPQTGRDRST